MNNYQEQRSPKPYLVTNSGNSNDMATISLILGIVAIPTGLFLIGFLIGLIAVLVGIAGLNRIREHPELGGQGKAVTGIFMGATGMVLAILVVIMGVIAYPYFANPGKRSIPDLSMAINNIQQAKTQANLAVVQSQLKQLHICNVSFFAENDHFAKPCRLTYQNYWYYPTGEAVADSLGFHLPSSANAYDFYIRRDGALSAIPNGLNPNLTGNIDSVYCTEEGQILVAWREE